MWINRVAIPAAFALAVSGCGVVGAPPTVTAREQLLLAVPGDGEPAYRYEASGACPAMSGTIDAPNRLRSTTVAEQTPGSGGTVTMTYLAVGRDRPWVRLTFDAPRDARLIGKPDEWYAVDPTRVQDFERSVLSYYGDPDPLGIEHLIDSATTVERTGDGTYGGDLDLTRIAGPHPILPDGGVAALSGAWSVPFTATVGKDGRLTELVADVPDGACKLTYGGFGATESPKEPAADREHVAPDGLYDLLNVS
ncbi:hypothetical protein AB0F81_08990 [Actinoplanes sp. NPDC024001]|uniref:hypothetical protein n=1 Tax=Actinoplanes sp. NPDC024001 TaxID=3154598 RepID=UPI0033E80EFE